MKDTLINYMRAGYAGLFLVTSEEQRAITEIAAACAFESTEQKVRPRTDVYRWSCGAGMGRIDGQPCEHEGKAQDPIEMFSVFATLPNRSVLIATDLHLFLGDAAYPNLIRATREAVFVGRTQGKCLIITGATAKLPVDLQKEITVLEFALPDAAQLRAVLHPLLTATKKPAPSPEREQEILRAAGGLTTTEAENAFSLSLAIHGEVVPKVVAREKAATVKKNGLLEICDTEADLSSIGGLQQLKEWLRRRRAVATDAARAYGLSFPKGAFLFGPPGTGKSLTAKATANILGGLPLVRCDVGAIFGSLVGQSEQNMRLVIQTAEAIAPCVLWIDEMDKAFQGLGSSGGSDGGTGARVLGTMLQWMTEKTAQVFVVGTANHPERLPAEILRKGRWDELFFVDLPTRTEREIIWTIQLSKTKRDPAKFDLGMLCAASEGYTGAEIETVVNDAMCAAYSDDEREFTTNDLLDAIKATQPVSKMMAEEIKAMRQWANGRARLASIPEASPATTGRKLDIEVN